MYCTYMYLSIAFYVLAPSDAGELMHLQGDTMYSQCQEYAPGIMATIRHQLKNTHFTNFPQLLNAFHFIDKARSKHM